MKKLILSGAAVVILLFVGAISCTNTEAKDAGKEVAGTDDLVTHGEYLVNTIGCDDCHSPKRMGPNGPELIPELRLSGYPSDAPLAVADEAAMKNGWVLLSMDLTSAVGPWGRSFAANLTPDPTGIGDWKEEQFFTAIREGKYKGLKESRPLMPPMPWFNYKKLSDYDLKSIFAYLKSMKPVKNLVPAYMPPSAPPTAKK